MKTETAPFPKPYCPHGVPVYSVCVACEEKARLEQREERLYAVLDRLAAAVDKLAEKLA